MHLNGRTAKKPPTWSIKAFPWRCHHCAKDEVFMTHLSYVAEIPHDGMVHSFTIPDLEIPVCRACGEKVFTQPVDDQINAALRAHLHLLTPAEMRGAVERVQMTPTELAERLGIAEDTLEAWLEDRQIQSRAMDNLLRVFFAFPRVRAALCHDAKDPLLGMADLAGSC